MAGHPLHPVVAAPPLNPPAFGPLPARWARGLLLAAAVGVAFTLLGWGVAHTRTAAGLLLAANYTLGMGLAALCFLVLVNVTGGRWATALRRVPEALAGTLWLGGVLVLLSFTGIGVLYEWSHADVVAGDPLLQAKQGWLDVGGFVFRGAVFLAVWWLFAAALRRHSLRQDEAPGPAPSRRRLVLSAAFLPVLAVTFSLATFDWLMSLAPHWFSTVFALYNFAGMFTAGLGALLVLTIVLRRLGPLAGLVRDDHLHDLGKLAFGFATFWAYLWFCQYMLIWYSNIPEETTWYVARGAGAWSVVMLLNPLVNWLVPFLALLARGPKRTESTLLKVGVLLLLGRWLDLYTLIQPTHGVLDAGPALGPWEVAPLLAGAALCTLLAFRTFGRARAVPVGDPALGASLAHHT